MNSSNDEPSSSGGPPPIEPSPGRKSWALALGTASVLVVGALLFWRAHAHSNKLKLESQPKGVIAVQAKGAAFRSSRRYVGTLEPWVQANIGPQLVSAYVDTVLVRPGAIVKKGQVIATLDCRNASATSKAVSMQAQALQSTQEAIADEARRINSLKGSGFVSDNEVEQKTAESASRQAQLLALRAQMLGSNLQVNDCILKSPFDGEVADRMKDPGAFVRPGSAIASIVDRRLIRVTADVPEEDFEAVAPGTQVVIRVLATGRELTRPIARRTPAADSTTRTIHLEIDVEDPEREFPVFTTAELFIDIGKSAPATELPLAAALIRGKNASLFVVEGERVHALTVPVMGEREGNLFVAPSLKSGSQVVLEGRMLLADGDRVMVKLEPWGVRQ